MLTARCLLAWCVLMVIALNCQAQSDTAELYRLNKSYVLSYFQDIPKVAAAPARYTTKDWLVVSGIATATGLLLAVDQPINKMMLRNQQRTFTQVSGVVEPFGNLYSPIVIGAGYLSGILLKDRKLEHTALFAAKSLAYSTSFYIVSKQLVRRQRPSFSENSFDFKAPFQGGRTFTSFPSGHTNTVFATATAFALEYKHKKWVPPVAYGIATLTGLSRLYDNRHWASDVLVGAAIGHFVTRTLYHIEQNKQKAKTPVALNF